MMMNDQIAICRKANITNVGIGYSPASYLDICLRSMPRRAASPACVSFKRLATGDKFVGLHGEWLFGFY